jgi:chlorite dismutase
MTTQHTESKPAGLPAIDVSEYGGKKDGERQAMNRRLFMQLLVFDVPEGGDAGSTADDVAALLQKKEVPHVLYADAMAPRGLGLLTWAEDPAHFVRSVRPLFAKSALREVTLRPSFGMLGRTYSIGHEPDLEHALLRRSVENVLREDHLWHVWYPLRRTGAFAKLEPQEQGSILRAHARSSSASSVASSTR